MIKGLIVFISIVLFFLGCTTFRAVRGENIQSNVTYNEKGEQSIYIAYHDSEYKKKIVDELVNRIGDQFKIEVNNLNSLRNIDPENYLSVIVLTPVLSFSLQKDVLHFLEKYKDSSTDIVYFITAMGTMIQYDGVDTITSASIHSNASKFQHIQPYEAALQIISNTNILSFPEYMSD